MRRFMLAALVVAVMARQAFGDATQRLLKALDSDNEHLTVKQVQRLIDEGADVNAKNEYDETPLMRAVFHEEIETELVKLFINAGAKCQCQR